MKTQFLSLIALISSTCSFGQIDTLFTNNEKIPCIVKEITPEAVKYSFEGEDLVNSIYKNTVQKIVFKSGRVQTFAESTSYKKINNVEDFDNVTITQVETEIKGLFKLGDVSSKAKGTTTLSNQERVKERAYRKLKIGAAMMGGNIIYLTDQRTEGNKYGSKYQAGSSAETNLSGIAYTNVLPNFDDFKKLINGRREFVAISQAKLWSSASDMTISSIDRNFTIQTIQNENGFIVVTADLDGERDYDKFRVVSFDKDSFNIYYEDKSTAYNVKIKL
jgi:hypothetical protein